MPQPQLRAVQIAVLEWLQHLFGKETDPADEFRDEFVGLDVVSEFLLDRGSQRLVRNTELGLVLFAGQVHFQERFQELVDDA